MSKKGNSGKKNSGTFKKILIWVIISILVLGTWYIYDDNKVVKETNYPEHTAYFYVEDYSGVLNEATERFIYDEAVKLNQATKAQVVVVTIPNTQQDSLEGFSVNLANKWGIGDKDLDNGVLLLFETDPDDAHVRMEVGKGLEGAIPDGKAGRILDDYAVEPKNDGRWNAAAGDTFVAVVKEVYAEYGTECPETVDFGEWEDESAPTEGTFADAAFPEAIEKPNEEPFLVQLGMAFFELLLIIGFFLIVIAIIAFVSIFGGSGGGGSGGYSSGGRSYGGGGGGGHSGGGGSFGGGGASR